MLRRRRRMAIQQLETRQMLSGVGWFEDSGQQPGANSFGTALGDLDNDGDLDAFVGCYNASGFGSWCEGDAVWLNDGNGHFSSSWSDSSSRVYVTTAVALGDLDSDGDLDAIIGRGTPGTGYPDQVWLNDGEGNFTDTDQSLGRGFTGDVDLADMDNDGDLDAVFANTKGSSSVWLNDGLGTFTDSGLRLGRGNTFSVALGDLDGDGDLDAFLGQGLNSRIDLVYLNDGEGNFSDSGQRLGRGWANAVELGDLDGDGDLDAFVANGDQFGASQPNEVWLNDGQGNFTDSGQDLGRSLSRWAELGDIDGDGDLDAFVANGTSLSGQPNRVWLNDGAGNFTDNGQSLGRLGSVGASLGDLDGDGDLDALVGQLGRPGGNDARNKIWVNVQLTAGDSNRDGRFDQKDIVEVLQAGKYNTGEPADWTEGDWNGDGVFDQFDIVAALQSGAYLAGA